MCMCAYVCLCVFVCVCVCVHDLHITGSLCVVVSSACLVLVLFVLEK